MNKRQTFGAFLKAKRKERAMTVRVIAENLGMALGYYGDVESGRRTPVDLDFLNKIIEILQLTDDDKRTLYDLAGKARSIAPPDLTEYINENNAVRNAIRIAKEKASDEDWHNFIDYLEKK